MTLGYYNIVYNTVITIISNQFCNIFITSNLFIKLNLIEIIEILQIWLQTDNNNCLKIKMLYKHNKIK